MTDWPKVGTTVVKGEVYDDLAALAAEAKARLAAWEVAAQQGHPSPCNLGSLCPYCEIDRLKARLDNRTAELVAVQARLAEAERLLTEARGGVQLHWKRWRQWQAEVDAVLRPPDSADVAQVAFSVTRCPAGNQLREWADHPASSGFVPIHPGTLRDIADELDRLRGVAVAPASADEVQR